MFVIINEKGQTVKLAYTIGHAKSLLLKMRGTYWLFPRARPLLGWVVECKQDGFIVRNPGSLEPLRLEYSK